MLKMIGLRQLLLTYQGHYNIASSIIITFLFEEKSYGINRKITSESAE